MGRRIGRAVIGAIAGLIIASFPMMMVIRVRGLLSDDEAPVLFALSFLGTALGAFFGYCVGGRMIRGRALRSVHGGIFGALFAILICGLFLPDSYRAIVIILAPVGAFACGLCNFIFVMPPRGERPVPEKRHEPAPRNPPGVWDRDLDR